MRASRSASMSRNSSSEISPISRRISASSSCSRSTESSFISASAAVSAVSSAQRMPEIMSESRMNILELQHHHSRFPVAAHRWPWCLGIWDLGFGSWDLGFRILLVLSGPFQLQPDVDEVIRRPRPRVLEGQLLEVRGDVLDPPVERLFLI